MKNAAIEKATELLGHNHKRMTAPMLAEILDTYEREQTAALRAALERVHRQMLNHGPLRLGDSCFVCEALAIPEAAP